MDVTQLVDKYGQDIADSLKIATGEVFDKLIWYTRVKGIYQLSETIAVVIWLLVGTMIAYKIGKKIVKTNNDGELWAPVISVALFIIPLLAFVIDMLFSAGIKILVPEYYLLDQIINKLAG